MHLGCKAFVGGPMGSLFGDGEYSGNIVQQNINGFIANNVNVDANVWIDNINVLPAGSNVTHLSTYSTVAGYTQKLYILRDNGSYNFTNVAELSITTLAGGWNFYALPTAYTVPTTGRYVLAFYGNYSGTVWGTSGQGNAVYGSGGGLPLGSSATFVLSTNYITSLGYKTTLQPQASYTSTIAWNASYGVNTYSSAFSGYLVVDRTVAALTPGTRISGFKFYEIHAGNKIAFGVIRRNSAGNWTPVARTADVTTGAGGYQYSYLASAYVVPNDGAEYRLFQYTLTGYGSYYSAATTYQRATVISNPVVGTAITGVAEGTGYVTGVDYVVVTTDAIVVTGAATVAPDATTDASVFSCKNLVLDGVSASLKASTNCKGLLGFISNGVSAVNGATVTMTGLGKAGNFGNINPYDLVPTTIRRKLSRSKLAPFTVKGTGAAGAAAITFTGTAQVNGLTGQAATLPLQSGGGGGGGARLGPLTGLSSKGGMGGPCCSGGGGGGFLSSTAGIVAAVTPDYGQGGAGVLDTANISYRADGGAGSPPGASVGSGSPNTVAGYGAGLLMLFSPSVFIGADSLICSDGTPGAGSNVSNSVGSGSSGGGIAAAITLDGGFANKGTIRAAGGALPVAASYGRGGAGGAGYAGNLIATSA